MSFSEPKKLTWLVQACCYYKFIRSGQHSWDGYVLIQWSVIIIKVCDCGLRGLVLLPRVRIHLTLYNVFIMPVLNETWMKTQLTKASNGVSVIRDLKLDRSILRLALLMVEESVALDNGWISQCQLPAHHNSSAVKGFQMQLRSQRYCKENYTRFTVWFWQAKLSSQRLRLGLLSEYSFLEACSISHLGLHTPFLSPQSNNRAITSFVQTVNALIISIPFRSFRQLEKLVWRKKR